jgi:hypothetical protein
MNRYTNTIKKNNLRDAKNDFEMLSSNLCVWPMQPLKEELPVVRPAPLREQRKAVTENLAITIKTRSRLSPITLFTQLVA